MIYKSLEPTLKRDSYIQISLVQKLKELMGEFINRKIIFRQIKVTSATLTANPLIINVQRVAIRGYFIATLLPRITTLWTRYENSDKILFFEWGLRNVEVRLT